MYYSVLVLRPICISVATYFMNNLPYIEENKSKYYVGVLIMAYVYRFLDYRTKDIIYVGKTKRPLETRMYEHFYKGGHLPSKCYNSVGRIEYITCKTEADAILVENYFINKYKPRYNTQDKVQSPLTVSIDVKDNWKLFKVLKKGFTFTPPKIPSVAVFLFWGFMAYFFLLGVAWYIKEF